MHKYIPLVEYSWKMWDQMKTASFWGRPNKQPQICKSNQQKEKWKQFFVNSKDKIILRMMTKHRKQQTSETKWTSKFAHMKK